MIRKSRKITTTTTTLNRTSNANKQSNICCCWFPCLVLGLMALVGCYLYMVVSVLFMNHGDDYLKPQTAIPPLVVRRREPTTTTKYPMLNLKNALKDSTSTTTTSTTAKQQQQETTMNGKPQEQQQQLDTMLRAYLEPIHQQDWDVKPLPVRNTSASKLTRVEFPSVTSCMHLLEQFPVDEYPDADPFLPWIHDVFPTFDAKFVQFVAQNKRRCHTGTTTAEKAILNHTAPQAALFQHVPVQRIEGGRRYQLTSHENADPDGVATRFICRFKPTMQETLSVHNVNYEYAAVRKGSGHLLTREGYDIKSIFTSQLLFTCPIPDNLQDQIRKGHHVLNDDDTPTLFVDVIPIRSPPRWGRPDEFLPPKYKAHESKTNPLHAQHEFGTNHVLPKIEDSGRWENIPICKTSLQQYQPTLAAAQGEVVVDESSSAAAATPKKHHRLIGCVWASAAYATRGERFTIQDGPRRLKEWLTFQFLVGFDHIYVYDNSMAHTSSDSSSLKPVTDLFPHQTTRIPWKARVCNNRPNNVDSPGERSSQYAAEASCKLRFGTHAEWLGGFDIDEYLVPMGNYTNLKQLLDQLDQEQTKIISFGSWRAWPRRKYIAEPVPITNNAKLCGRKKKSCFELKIPNNHTILQTYNCDRQKGQKKKVMPAEKQLYKPDYVKLHFVHYSTITELAQLSKQETLERGLRWRPRISADPASRFSNEATEGTMLHTKAIATKDTTGWPEVCQHNQGFCRIGNPWPNNTESDTVKEDSDGWSYNCFVNDHIDDYWVPRLVAKDPFL